MLALAPAATAQAPPEAPILTGFEQRLAAAPAPATERVAWTSLEEEAQFLAAVDAASDRVASTSSA